MPPGMPPGRRSVLRRRGGALLIGQQRLALCRLASISFIAAWSATKRSEVAGWSLAMVMAPGELTAVRRDWGVERFPLSAVTTCVHSPIRVCVLDFDQ